MKRWLRGTSGRAYLLWPILLVSAEAAWFQRQVLDGEARLAAPFGGPNREYLTRAKRWNPGLL